MWAWSQFIQIVLSYICHSFSRRKPHLHGCNSVTCDCYGHSIICSHCLLPSTAILSSETAPLHAQQRCMAISVCPHQISSSFLTFAYLTVVKWVLLLFSHAFPWFPLKFDISPHNCYPCRFLLLRIAYSFFFTIFFSLLIHSLYTLDINLFSKFTLILLNLPVVFFINKNP